MAYQFVGAFDDEFMVVLHLRHAAPIGAERDARPDGKAAAKDGYSKPGRLYGDGVRPKAQEKPIGRNGMKDHEQIEGNERKKENKTREIRGLPGCRFGKKQPGNPDNDQGSPGASEPSANDRIEQDEILLKNGLQNTTQAGR